MAGDGIGDGYWVPECVRAYLRTAGYSTRALEDMEPHVREWDRWMRAAGEFYDYGGHRRVRAGLPGAPQDHHAGDAGSPVERAAGGGA